MKLSKNFSLKEFTKSQTAARKGIDNTPDIQAAINLTALCNNVLQAIRDEKGSVTINSGYRCTELNRAIGSSDTSQHRVGEAADIEVMGVDNYELAQWIDDNIVFDQLILEGYEDGDTNSGWLHISYKADGSNRNKTLTARFVNGKANYTNGIHN